MTEQQVEDAVREKADQLADVLQVWGAARKLIHSMMGERYAAGVSKGIDMAKSIYGSKKESVPCP